MAGGTTGVAAAEAAADAVTAAGVATDGGAEMEPELALWLKAVVGTGAVVVAGRGADTTGVLLPAWAEAGGRAPAGSTCSGTESGDRTRGMRNTRNGRQGEEAGGGKGGDV